jgi:hypothetical protein
MPGCPADPWQSLLRNHEEHIPDFCPVCGKILDQSSFN